MAFQRMRILYIVRSANSRLYSTLETRARRIDRPFVSRTAEWKRNRENIYHVCTRSSLCRQFLESGQVDSLRVKLLTRRQIYIYIYDNCTLLLLLCDEKETDAVGETEVRLNHCFWAAVNFRFRYTMTSAHCTLYPSAYPSPPSIVIDVAPRQGIKEMFDALLDRIDEFG